MTRISCWALALAIAGSAVAPSLTAPVHAQLPAPRIERSSLVRPSSAAAAGRDAALSMRKMLRLMTTAQEQHFADHSTYTTRVDVLRAAFRAAWDDQVQVRIIQAGARAWSAVAVHPALPGRSCVIHVGDAGDLAELPGTAGGRRSQEEGVPVCDEP